MHLKVIIVNWQIKFKYYKYFVHVPAWEVCYFPVLYFYPKNTSISCSVKKEFAIKTQNTENSWIIHDNEAQITSSESGLKAKVF